MDFTPLYPVVAHVKAHTSMYIVIAAVAALVVLLTRKHSVPYILYALENCIYAAILHGVIHVLVILAAWFKVHTDIENTTGPKGEPTLVVSWATPLIGFWQRQAYDPAWLFSMEAVMMGIIIFLTWRYRPPKLDYRRPKSKMFDPETKARRMKILGRDYSDLLDKTKKDKK